MMSAYLDVFEELKCFDHVKFTFSAQDKTFLVYAFFEENSSKNSLYVFRRFEWFSQKQRFM